MTPIQDLILTLNSKSNIWIGTDLHVRDSEKTNILFCSVEISIHLTKNILTYNVARKEKINYTIARKIDVMNL